MAETTAAVQHPISDSNEQSPFGKFTPSEFYAKHGVSHQAEHRTNSRGFNLFTQWWSPLAPAEKIGCIAMVHGFIGESSWLLELTSIFFAKHGFLVCAIDHQGHGFSDSLDGFIHHMPDINPVVDDCIDLFTDFRASHAPGLPAFLYSESLGGAIALLVTLKQQKGAWDGLILNAAMCGLTPKFNPSWPLERLLSAVAAVIPTWRVVPTGATSPDVSYKVEWKRKLAMASPRWSGARPRTATVLELLRVCMELQGRFEEVEVPLLISHGGDDVVCDPACVEELYRRASSKDKTLKIYPGLWHHMVGEEEESVNLVFGDMIAWLKARVDSKSD
ncbi:unnamed protein product [Linum trigynum]|uniref:Serine aminopeptidase S33 domain-containing protein n=1 Tax=Linum trigynum TaxID=586398 RepID=A0AAV2DKV2_9ROSI